MFSHEQAFGGGEQGFSSGPEKNPVLIFSQEISPHCYVKPKTQRRIQSKQYNFTCVEVISIYNSEKYDSVGFLNLG